MTLAVDDEIAIALPVVGYGILEPADLYFRKRSRTLFYRRFESASAAMGYARNTLSADELGSCVIEVGDRRMRLDAGRQFVTDAQAASK
jgi:hypothetical protein